MGEILYIIFPLNPSEWPWTGPWHFFEWSTNFSSNFAGKPTQIVRARMRKIALATLSARPIPLALWWATGTIIGNK
jgi:hypothetical protein